MTLVGSMLGAPLATGAQAAGPTAHTNAADDAIRSDLRNLASETEAWLSRPSINPDFDSIGYDGRRVVTFMTWPRKKWAPYTREVTLTRGDRLKTIKLSKNESGFCIRVIRSDDAKPATDQWRYLTTRYGNHEGVSRGQCPDRYMFKVSP
jgi:hypothetical protein